MPPEGPRRFTPEQLRQDAKSLRIEAAAVVARAKDEAEQVLALAKIESQVLISRAEANDVAAAEIERRLDLRRRNGSSTVRRVSDTVSSAAALPKLPDPPSGPKPKRRGPPGKPGRTLKEVSDALGFAGLADLARAIGEKYASIRVWNHRGRVPAPVQEKIAALLEKATAAKSSAKK